MVRFTNDACGWNSWNLINGTSAIGVLRDFPAETGHHKYFLYLVCSVMNRSCTSRALVQGSDGVRIGGLEIQRLTSISN
jgi:hypothetical protein